MTYSIGLNFDKITQDKIKEDMIMLCQKGINSYILDNNIPPHLTLYIFEEDDLNIDYLYKLVEAFSKVIKSGDITFSSIGTFNPPQLFYSPVVTRDLIDIHDKLYSKLKSCVSQISAYYVPNKWIPHVALGYKMSQYELLSSFQYLLEKFHAFEGQYNKLVLATCNPYKEIYIVDLAGK